MRVSLCEVSVINISRRGLCLKTWAEVEQDKLTGSIFQLAKSLIEYPGSNQISTFYNKCDQNLLQEKYPDLCSFIFLKEGVNQKLLLPRKFGEIIGEVHPKFGGGYYYSETLLLRLVENYLEHLSTLSLTPLESVVDTDFWQDF